jgi:hypothetical protein
MALEAAGVGLRVRRRVAAVQLAAARKMAERVDMGAHMSAQRQAFGRRTGATARHVVAMFLVQSEQERRMIGMVRHAWVIGLRQVVDARRSDGREELLHKW